MNAGAYVITGEACKRMNESAPPVRANADDWRFFYKEGILDRVRCVLPLAVVKNPKFESTIGLYSLGNGVKTSAWRDHLCVIRSHLCTKQFSLSKAAYHAYVGSIRNHEHAIHREAIQVGIGYVRSTGFRTGLLP